MLDILNVLDIWTWMFLYIILNIWKNELSSVEFHHEQFLKIQRSYWILWSKHRKSFSCWRYVLNYNRILLEIFWSSFRVCSLLDVSKIHVLVVPCSEILNSQDLGLTILSLHWGISKRSSVTLTEDLGFIFDSVIRKALSINFLIIL